MTKVNLTIKNPHDPSLTAEQNFLVDSGVHYTVIPIELVKKLNLKSSYEQDFVLADGKVIKRKVGGAIVKFENRELPVAIILGEKGDSPLLGVTTLESFGLMLDPFKRKLYHSKLMLG
ncbi:TPA: aspartyl protease [Patescibacteria group bacterium]|uniref:Aspartyl protease n=1 Tax=Candidatus Gottesmanbacteria bacterium GW2011_GWA1_43_11 TaxID=1618436 RepID=A0A0G1CG59_9BACT|nr:MAG: hypothetical protein UV59_C0019G0039 [Candidatus Gottesmanbacteria bacterium GW2011_GWA1_43_11]HCS78736.1 aspartyl protease [Patescibacteria group bacterium]